MGKSTETVQCFNKSISVMQMWFFFAVQQRYVLTAALFVTLGVTFALRISFSLLLTQMVYIPNANTDSLNTVGFSSEEICPIEYPVGPQNGSNWVCEKNI